MTTSSAFGREFETERIDGVCLVDLQRVETELEAVATTQQQETREVCRLKETIRSISEDLNSIKEQLARNNKRTKSGGRQRKKIPPVLSVSLNLL